MMSLSVHSFSFMRHNSLFQPPLFPSVYDFGFLLYCHSVMPSMSGPSLLSFLSFESTTMPLTVVAFFYFSIAIVLFFLKKGRSELHAVLMK